jgi:hypothetical protein
MVRMSRRIIYRIDDRKGSIFTESEWEGIDRLQHWYNSEFSWSTGRLAMKRYVVFPNSEDFQNVESPIWEVIGQRHASLRSQGLSGSEIIAQMEKDKLIIVKWGGYYDNCLASGFTRVADNEWNAYLVCDFLLKASTLCPNATISALDEGRFIKTGEAHFRDGSVEIGPDEEMTDKEMQDLCATRRVFSVVDAEKYDRHPAFRNVIPEFNRLKMSERNKLVKNWNWLGYEGNFDANGDDLGGFDLNTKVRSFAVGE